MKQNKLKNAVLINCDIDQWSGKTRMKEDEAKEVGVVAPKDFAELGNKCLLDPKKLRPFNRLRDEVDAYLSSIGEKFSGTFLISKDDLPGAMEKLKEIKIKFETAKKDFIHNYEFYISNWASRAKEKGEQAFARFIVNSYPDREDIERRFKCDITVLNCEGPDEEFNKLLEKKVDGLGENLLLSICKEAEEFYQDRLFQSETVNKRSKAILVGWHKKLASLSFLNSRFRPMLSLLEQAIEAYDTSNGTLQGKHLHTVMAAVLMLSSTKTIDKFASGDLTVRDVADQTWSQATNQIPLTPAPDQIEPTVIEPEPFVFPHPVTTNMIPDISTQSLLF